MDSTPRNESRITNCKKHATPLVWGNPTEIHTEKAHIRPKIFVDQSNKMLTCLIIPFEVSRFKTFINAQVYYIITA